MRLGASDYNLRSAIQHGVPPEIAIQCVTLNPAKHMRIDAWVGSITPGRYADLVLLDDVTSVSISAVYADGLLVSQGKQYLGPQPDIFWPEWATKTLNIGCLVTAADFAVSAPSDRRSAQAALLRPFHWNQDFLTAELAVENGEVQRDVTRKITKFAIIDRYGGNGKLASMFWLGCGPADPETALACSVAHDSHNVWTVGSSDRAMAMAVNRLQEIAGGWVLVHRGEIVAEVRYEIGGLMTARPAEALDREMQQLYSAAEKIDWMYEPSVTKIWKPGFPETLIFATLTCLPWRWVFVVPSDQVSSGLVNVSTGQSHPVVW